MNEHDSIPASEALIYFDETKSPPVRVLRIDSEPRERYRGSMGASHVARRSLTAAAQCLMVMIDFNTLVVREQLPVASVHDAFLNIVEYRQVISRDTPGAEEQGVELEAALRKAGLK